MKPPSTWSCFLLLILVIGVLFVDGSISKVRLNNEKLLIKTLTENYGQKLGMPFMKDGTEPLLIKLRIQLIQIVEVDAIKQVLSTNIWSSYTWQDPFLTWDPAQYNGLETIRIPASFAFEHDITMLNSADERLEFKREALLVIYHTGDLLWIPRSLFTSTCYIDLKVFPFDKQNCSLSFGSWAYDSKQIDLGFQDDIENIDLNDYEKSKEWNLDPEESMAVKHYRQFEGKNYTVLTYSLIMRRNPRFYTYLLLYPCIMLAFLTMTVFWLPPENPSKIILGMSIFSGFFLLLLLLADLVPTSTNEVPYIGLYFCLNMVMIALSSFLCTIVVHMYFRADTFCRVPKIIKKIFLEWLAYIYLMKPAKSSQSVTQRTLLNSGLLLGGKNVPNADKFEKFELLKERFKSYRENVLKIGFENLLKTHPSTLTASSCMNLNHHHNMSMSNFNLNHASSTAASSPTSTLNLNAAASGGNNRQGTTTANCQCGYCTYVAQQQTVLAEIAYLNNLEHDVKEIRDYLRDTRKKLETRELKVRLASDWKQIALVLDRTFFFIYLFITATTLILYYREMSMSQKQVNTTKKVPTPTETTAAAAAAAATTGVIADGSLVATTTEAMVANLAQPAARMLRAIASVTAQTLSFSRRSEQVDDDPPPPPPTTDDNQFLFY